MRSQDTGSTSHFGLVPEVVLADTRSGPKEQPVAVGDLVRLGH